MLYVSPMKQPSCFINKVDLSFFVLCKIVVLSIHMISFLSCYKFKYKIFNQNIVISPLTVASLYIGHSIEANVRSSTITVNEKKKESKVQSTKENIHIYTYGSFSQR
jgi:hypothetical protein